MYTIIHLVIAHLSFIVYRLSFFPVFVCRLSPRLSPVPGGLRRRAAAGSQRVGGVGDASFPSLRVWYAGYALSKKLLIVIK